METASSMQKQGNILDFLRMRAGGERKKGGKTEEVRGRVPSGAESLKPDLLALPPSPLSSQETQPAANICRVHKHD